MASGFASDLLKLDLGGGWWVALLILMSAEIKTLKN